MFLVATCTSLNFTYRFKGLCLSLQEKRKQKKRKVIIEDDDEEN